MKRNNLVYSVTKWIARLVFSTLYRIETQREEDLPFQGALVILPKHQYWTDIPLVGLSFHFPLYFVAKRELFHFPGIRSYLRLLGGIPLDRERSIKTLNSFRSLLSRLRAGEKIVIFPEGTYVRNGVGPGKSRLLQMVLGFQSKLGRQISFIPVGIRYGERVRWRRDVEIRIGRALFAEKESDAITLTGQVMKEIGRLSQLPHHA